MSAKSNVIIPIIATASAVFVGFYFASKRKRRQPVQEEKEPTARVFGSTDDLRSELCSYIVERAKIAIDLKGNFYLAVAGGSLLDLLGKLQEHKDDVDFSKFILSCVNHKCVRPDSEQATIFKSKIKFANAAGITTFIVPAAEISQDSDGTAEADFYAKALINGGVPHTGGYPEFDLILLGLGADGHVGSCHPMSAAVIESNKSVAASPKEGEPSSVTLTIESMNSAKQIVVVVCGGNNGKKEAVKRALKRPAEEPRGTFPAQLLKAPLFFLDTEAAGEL